MAYAGEWGYHEITSEADPQACSSPSGPRTEGASKAPQLAQASGAVRLAVMEYEQRLGFTNSQRVDRKKAGRVTNFSLDGESSSGDATCQATFLEESGKAPRQISRNVSNTRLKLFSLHQGEIILGIIATILEIIIVNH